MNVVPKRSSVQLLVIPALVVAWTQLVAQQSPPKLALELQDYVSMPITSDGEMFTVIKRGVPPTMMPSLSGVIPDNDIWSVINYLRSLGPGRQTLVVAGGIATKKQ